MAFLLELHQDINQPAINRHLSSYLKMVLPNTPHYRQFVGFGNVTIEMKAFQKMIKVVQYFCK